MRPEHSQWKKGLIVSERDMRGLREMLLRRRRGIFQRFESDWQALGERDIELEEEGQMEWDGLFSSLIREYLFVSLYRAFAESLASENASRLASMQVAERNIEDRLVDLSAQFHQQRQSSIDEELFDLVAGFEALTGKAT